MKKKIKWWQITALIINLVGAIFLVLCIAADLKDDVFLPAALACILAGNGLQLICNLLEQNKSC